MKYGKMSPHKKRGNLQFLDYKLHIQNPSNSSLSGWEGGCIKISYRFLSFIDKVFCSPSWPGPHCVAKDGRELPILLPSSHTC